MRPIFGLLASLMLIPLGAAAQIDSICESFIDSPAECPNLCTPNNINFATFYNSTGRNHLVLQTLTCTPQHTGVSCPAASQVPVQVPNPHCSGGGGCGSPIAISLTGEEIIGSLSATEDGVPYDLKGNGNPQWYSWQKRGSHAMVVGYFEFCAHLSSRLSGLRLMWIPLFCLLRQKQHTSQLRSLGSGI
jgi:hypothetical protein